MVQVEALATITVLCSSAENFNVVTCLYFVVYSVDNKYLIGKG